MTEMEKATEQWKQLTAEMQTYITRLQARIDELTAENKKAWEEYAKLKKQLGLKPTTEDIFRPIRTSMRNLDVTLKGGKAS